MNSSSAGFLVMLLILRSSTTEGEEWAVAEVVAILESSGKPTILFTGPRLTVKDWSSLRAPSVNVVATCIVFVWLTDGLWKALELGSFILAGAEEWSEEGE